MADHTPGHQAMCSKQFYGPQLLPRWWGIKHYNQGSCAVAAVHLTHSHIKAVSGRRYYFGKHGGKTSLLIS